MDLSVRRLAALAAAAAMTMGAGAAIAPAAHADAGQALLEVGRLSDGATASVNPGTMLPGLSYNEGAAGKFGVDAPLYMDGTNTFTFTPPAGTSIAAAKVWPRIVADGWPAYGYWVEILSSWGNYNVGGATCCTDLSGLWAQGGSGQSIGAVSSLSVSARQGSIGSGTPVSGYFYTDKLDITLADANPPAVDQAPADGQLFGAAPASGWYTAATLPVTLKASDQGLGVRWLLIKDGAAVHRYPLPGTGASCATKDPNASLMGGDTYTVKVPCPTASASYTVNVDMTEIGDGAHNLQLGVMDASGRSSYGAAYTANVNAPGLNPSPGGGSGLPDAGDVGPGGCVYQVDGTTCMVPITNTGLPTITGIAKVGQTLTAGNGMWTGTADATFTYQWERNVGGSWTAITSASNTYTLVAADEGRDVRVKVTATVGGSSQSAYSTGTGTVAAAGGGGLGGTSPGGGGTPKPQDPTPAAPRGGEDPTPAPGPTTSGPTEAPPGAPNGTPATRDATVSASFAGNGKTAIAAKYSTGLRVRGRVKTAKGAPIAYATVVIRARNTAPGAKPGKLATTKTDSKGRYETTIARGPSRKITVSYTAFAGDADPADSATVTVKVKAAAKLVTNVRTVRVGQALKLSGHLVHPQAGVMVLICATDAGKWRSFDHVRTDRKGRFHYTYKFKPGSEGRKFGFSVLVDDRVYPFLAGYSNQVTVRVAR